MAVEQSKRDRIVRKLQALKTDEFSNAEAIVDYASELRDMSFEEVLALELSALLPSSTYSDSNRKGAVGNLLEEHYFGYTINSDSAPDFPNAGMELKVSPIEYGNNRKKEWVVKASERLVLTMIPNTCEIPVEYEKSPLEKKASDVLLINYLRDREVAKTEQVIKYITRLQVSGEDLEIIRADYKKIVKLVQAGRAHELSEGMTNYLGASTKGTTAKKSISKQFYPYIHADGSLEYIPAKRRAFSFKQSFMTSLIQKIERTNTEADSLISDPQTLKENSFEDYVINLLKPLVGRSDADLHTEYGEKLNKKAKNYWAALTAKMLGVKTEKIEEFNKANIDIKTIKINEKEELDEHTKLLETSFNTLHGENQWEESEWYRYLIETKILFIVFREDKNKTRRLQGGFFWSAPLADVGSEDSDTPEATAYGYWLNTKRVLNEGVKLTQAGNTIRNNFINASDHPFCHIRPSATKAAYAFTDGRPPRGNVKRDAEQLPDGQHMTKQAFWLGKHYIKEILIQEGFLPGA
ncbi:Sau3AI family type II restriction endonuclease [Rothia nasimurium]|uniref:Sau3AI family type II restriction endonuclease n=1 Tax=Rothia nasimurium TaxID=85336 RepID=UPI001F195642|nr:Sau3AI family type II restriction endonuclease [Rothia nasimurium]